MSYKKIIALCESLGCAYETNAPMKNYVSMRVGGNADLLIKPNSTESLCEFVKTAKEENIPFYILGNGSNVIVKDSGIRGVVILISSDFASVEVNDDTIKCEAGVTLSKLCQTALENSLTGLEFAWGIPGTVGGAVYMNAGAYGGEISKVIESCTYLDEDMNIVTVKVDDMDLSYRHSMFTDTKKVILTAEFKLQKSEKSEIKSAMDEKMTARKTKQPLEYPSSGSTFKRPVGGYASKLIEDCGLKGETVGGAQVSKKHSGFVINIGNATCEDILKLIEIVKKTVYEKTGIMLEEEVKII